MLKLGLLIYNKGAWNGKQIVSREWVEQSTKPRVQIGSRRYGYLWWTRTFRVPLQGGRFQDIDATAASGNGGQKIYIIPQLDLVAVFTGGSYNSDFDSPPNDIMPQVILPQLLEKR